MIALLLIASFILNIWYLASFRSLMAKLEAGATSYWESIGMPNSFAGTHVSAVLSNLYRKEMTRASVEAGVFKLLRNVRMLLPATFVVTGYTLYILAETLNR